ALAQGAVGCRLVVARRGLALGRHRRTGLSAARLPLWLLGKGEGGEDSGEQEGGGQRTIASRPTTLRNRGHRDVPRACCCRSPGEASVRVSVFLQHDIKAPARSIS